MERFEAEILFLDPDLAVKGIVALAAAGCKFEHYPDWVDDCGPTVFGMVTGTTELDEDALWDWLMRIIDPFSGDVCEWGLVSETEKRLRQRSCCENCGEKLADPLSKVCPACGALIVAFDDIRLGAAQ